MQSIYIANPDTVRDLSSDLLDPEGQLKIVPSSLYSETTIQERAIFGMRHAFYGFLTIELVHFVKEFIHGRSALEIGSGHGGLARALGIRATDNRMQENEAIRRYYDALNQPVIKYGANVERLDAIQAVAKYRPSVVVASWVTHRYDPRRHKAGGNQDGVTEEDIINGCDAYLFIGNQRIHAGKSIWSLPHEIITPPWLYSRASNGSPDFISIWSKR